MNKAILVLNALILVVNAALTFVFDEPQSKAADSERTERAPTDPGIDRVFVRVIDSLEGRIPHEQLENLSLDQIQTIRGAVALHRRLSGSAADDALREAGGGAFRTRLAELKKRNRLEVERVLSTEFGDRDQARQIAAIILRES